jgi:hypothetical protein
LLVRAVVCGLFLTPACALAGQTEAASEHAVPPAVEPAHGAVPCAPRPASGDASSQSNRLEGVSALPAGTPVYVVLEDDLSTATAELGQVFRVTVCQDVVAQGAIAIPSGTEGWGEVTFVSRRGGFGKPGILGITLREMALGGKTIALDGRYREEGRNNNTATAITFFAVGVFAGVIKGAPGDIPKGRVLKARTGENIELAGAAKPPESPASEGSTATDGGPQPAQDAPAVAADGATADSANTSTTQPFMTGD